LIDAYPQPTASRQKARTEDEDSGSTELAKVQPDVAFAVEGRQLWDKRSRDDEDENDGTQVTSTVAYWRLAVRHERLDD
jgi:hypothetical protein